MPIRPENRAKYPDNWPEIRQAILQRAGYRCEWCKVAQYAVGHRNADGLFFGICGNIHADCAGNGQHYPSLDRLTYAEAREWADSENDWREPDEPRTIVIVLTIAHVHDPEPSNCDPSNLAALCQRCHNRHDAADRAAGRKERRETGGQLMLF